VSKELAQLIFPKIDKTPECYLEKFPPRRTPALRIAPSPTGNLHIGTIATALVNQLLAKSMGGIFYLRIEDTDKKREVEGSVDGIINGFAKFGIEFDEFAGKQSERTEIYHTFAKDLVARGHAYPCFCEGGQNYRGVICSNLTHGDIKTKIENGEPWCLRFNSGNIAGQRITWNDLVRGEMSLPAQENHFVILKSDGIPPYNFAHVVDDTLMRTSHVIRGEEWLPSTAEHIQIHAALFGRAPAWHYAHTSALCVIDEESGTKRKISKRKDTFAAADWFLAAGYPMDGIYEYIMTLYFPSFEKWRIENPLLPHTDFAVDFSKLGNQSLLFDFPKFEHICKNIIARMTKSEIREHVTKFGITNEKILQALEIDREGEKPRKDIAKLGEIPELFDYLITPPKSSLSPEEKSMIAQYTYKSFQTREEWFDDIKSYPFKPKDLTQAIRRVLTGRDNTPDLFAIKQILGTDEVKVRLKQYL